MKIPKKQLMRIIKEEIATVNKEKIEDTVMDTLSAEGGAAGLEPIEDALEDLEDDDISLPEEPIEDVIAAVTGVKRHADGDYVDTTQLESKRIKISKLALERIIKEEKARILSEQVAGYEEGAILERLAAAESLFEAYADRYGSEEWTEQGTQGDSEEKHILDKMVGLTSLLESYFDQFGPRAFG